MFGFAAGIGTAAYGVTAKDHSTLMTVIDVVVGVGAIASLWLRRSRPVAVGVFALVASAFSTAAFGAAFVALFNAAIRVSPRTLARLILLAMASNALSPLVYPTTDPYWLSLFVGTLLTAIAVGWGLFARVQRDLVVSLHERTDRAESEQQLRVAQAREGERLRIAREMHDALAHRISLLSLHAGALEFRPDATREEITQASGVIRAEARDALQELSDILGVLRDGAPGESPEPPQPTFSDIPALIEQSRAAGMNVEWQSDFDAGGALPEAVGRAAYRIVQEGLTNARKHAPSAAVEVSIAGSGSDVIVEVVSRRSLSTIDGGASSPLPGAGSGLIGLTERAELAGGQLEYGPGRRGDFTLRATLPSGA